MLLGKTNLSYRKKDLDNQKSIGLGFTKLNIAHKCVGGETSIDLTNLTVPTELTSTGFTNPTSAQIAEVKMLFYKSNVSITRSSGGKMIPWLEYQIISSSKINLTSAALANEIFYITVDYNPSSGMIGVDGRKIVATGTLSASQTDINAGTEFAINANSSTQLGEVALYIDGTLQMRNVGNSSVGEGNYYELPVSGGLGSVLRMNSSEIFDRAYVVMSTATIVMRPDGSRDAALESLAGQMSKVVTTLAAVAGVPESDFGSNPSEVNLLQFGNLVLSLQQSFNALLQKLDADAGVTDTNYYSTLKIS